MPKFVATSSLCLLLGAVSMLIVGHVGLAMFTLVILVVNLLLSGD